MILLPFERRWTQQPPIDSLVADRFADGLAAVIDGDRPMAIGVERPYPGYQIGTSVVGTRSAGDSGIGWLGSASTSVDLAGSAELFQLASGSDWTIQFVVDNVGVASGTNPGWIRNGLTQIGTELFVVTNGASRRPWVRVNGIDILKPTTGPQWQDGSTVNLIVRNKNASKVEAWFSGALQHSATHAQNQPSIAGAAGVTKLLSQSATENLRGNMAAFRVWRRYLDDDSISTLANAPWELYEQRRIWVPVAAGSGGISGSLSSTLADVTLSAASTLSISGALAATLANATLAATGTVGSTITGSAAITLAGATLSASGALPIAGALSTTLAGVTLSAASTLGIAGALSSTLADVTLSATATSVTGNTGAASIALADVTLTAAGVLPIAGSAAITLAGASLSASATLALKGALAKTLDGVSLSATGQDPNAVPSNVSGDPYGGSGKGLAARKRKTVVINKDDREERAQEFEALLARVKGQAEDKAASAAKAVPVVDFTPEKIPDIKPPRMPTVTGVESVLLRQWMPDLIAAFDTQYRDAYTQQVMAKAAQHRARLQDDEEVLLLMHFL